MKAKRTAVAANAKLLANPLAKLLAVLQIKNARKQQNNNVGVIDTKIAETA